MLLSSSSFRLKPDVERAERLHNCILQEFFHRLATWFRNAVNDHLAREPGPRQETRNLQTVAVQPARIRRVHEPQVVIEVNRIEAVRDQDLQGIIARPAKHSTGQPIREPTKTGRGIVQREDLPRFGDRDDKHGQKDLWCGCKCGLFHTARTWIKSVPL